MAFLEMFVLAVSIVASKGYIPHGSIGEKDPIITEALLREVVAGMGRDLDSSSWDFPSERLALMVRGNKDLENEQMDYDSLLDGNPNPSLRDQEYLQHSSLWGPQYMAGGAAEVQRLPGAGRALGKTDAVLPAYCNPPNPCPIGYTEEQGCISDFENTASFSRDYQGIQRCMCDAEHMFACGPDAHLDLRYSDKGLSKKEDENPYLTGERLPIAAKKGVDVTAY